jgi:coproporphyrinogen III oxidase-like Fe-S oxidoreductase
MKPAIVLILFISAGAHLESNILRILKDTGVNRLSVGVQSFNNEILKSTQRLEKYGTGEEIKDRLSSIVKMFDTLNIDMIFNFPNQSEQMLSEDIETIKEICADQITYYPLIISNYQKHEITKRFGMINYKKERQLHQQLIEELSDMYNQESIWCFSNRKGLIDEYIINHEEYAGIGAGAMGYVNGTIHSNTCSIQQYINLIQQGKSSIIRKRKFSRLQRMRYRFMLKLLSGTVKISDMTKKYGNRFWFYLSGELSFLFINRAIRFRDNHIILTPTGRYYCLILMRTLFSIVGDFREVQSSLDTVQFAELLS